MDFSTAQVLSYVAALLSARAFVYFFLKNDVNETQRYGAEGVVFGLVFVLLSFYAGFAAAPSDMPFGLEAAVNVLSVSIKGASLGPTVMILVALGILLFRRFR